MNLPHRFLADLPAGSVPSSAAIRETCLTIKQNRRAHLAGRSTAEGIEWIDQLARNWSDSTDPFRRLALTQAPDQLGIGKETFADGLDQFFATINRESLTRLIAQDLGHAGQLDGLMAAPAGGSSWVRGPELIAHITAGNIPNPALLSMILGLLTRSAQFIKCASGTSILPRLFAHSLEPIQPRLVSCFEIAEWPRHQPGLEDTLFAQADCVTATGRDETIESIRNRLPPHVRFAGYGHRVSFAVITRSATRGRMDALARAAARDVAAWNQLGCLSPHLIYVQEVADSFAPRLAEALAEIESSHPRGPVAPETTARITGKRDFYQIRADHSAETRIWSSPGSTAWTVVYEADPIFQLSCLNRFVYVKTVADLDEALRYAEPVRQHVSTVGLAADPVEESGLASQLAAWGATRICPLGQMQRPPLTWRHDGRPPLGDLITWTDWEPNPAPPNNPSV